MRIVCLLCGGSIGNPAHDFLVCLTSFGSGSDDRLRSAFQCGRMSLRGCRGNGMGLEFANVSLRHVAWGNRR